jgi:hypothetical protein
MNVSPGRWIVIRIALWGLFPVIAVAIAIPGLYASRRASNERAASAALKTLTWTADVAGLYTLRDIRLIEPQVAAADAAPVLPLSAKLQPRQGYRYQALVYDNSASEGEDLEYRQATVKGGPAHYHASKFGFGAYPMAPREGVFQYLVNENNTIFRVSVERLGIQLEWPSDRVLKGIFGSSGMGAG